MKKAFKTGLGISLGLCAGEVVKYFVRNLCEKILTKNANDEQYMTYLKIRNPDLYERLLKYRKNN